MNMNRWHFIKWRQIVAAVALSVTCFSTVAQASIAVAPGYFDSTVAPGATRTSDAGGGLIGLPATGTPTWDGGNISIDWLITDNLDGTWRYQYWIDVAVRSVSHLLLELSPFDHLGNSLTAYWEGIFGEGKVGTTTPPHAGNPDLPASIYGAEIDGGGQSLFHIDFTADQSPVWGDIYVKDGNQPAPQGGGAIVAYNTGFGTDPASDADPFTNWIPRPNGLTPPGNGEGAIPEPTTLIVWSLLLGTCGLLSARRGRGGVK